MLRPRWRKVLRDLWLNRTRTILVILSIAVGVFAVGVIAATRTVLAEQLNAAYMAINPASGLVLSFNAYDEEVVDSVKSMREIEGTEARRQVSVRVKLADGNWQLLQLNAIDDFEDIEVDKIWSAEGKWPPKKEDELIIEASALRLVQAEVGDTITIKAPNGKIREATIVGTADDIYAQMYTMGGIAYGYMTFDTLEWLGEPREFNDLRFTVAENPLDREHIKYVSQKVQDKVEQAGADIWFVLIPIPGQHPMNFIIQPILALLGLLSVLALILSVFLVINMISALLTQQQQQIGIMKAIGASTWQIVRLYYMAVIIFGGLSLTIAVPLGIIGANLLAQGLATMMSLKVTQFGLSTEVMVLQIAVGLIVPVLAATYPIIMGTQITVREAISGYGLGKGSFGTNIIDRFLVQLHTRILARPTIISIRNTFRRKGRLALTLITLVMAGAIFITVFSVQSSLYTTLEAMLEYYQYDVAIQFSRSYRLQKAASTIMEVEGLETAEGWIFTNIRRLRPDGTESDNIVTFAPPLETKLVKPTVVKGRWLQPGDTNAVVINTLMLNDEPDLEVGSKITVKVGDKEHTWTIVGVALGGGVTSAMFSHYDDMAKILRRVGKVEWIFTQTTEKTPEYRLDVLRRLEEHLSDKGMRVGIGLTVDQDRQSIEMMFAVIVMLMSVMAVLLAVVGALGLMGTMSINVLERIREVGVMRAVGASDWAIIQIVTIEGMLIGAMSWAMSVIIAVPVSKLISDEIGRNFLGSELAFTFSIGGTIGWLVLVVFLSALASFLPAWNASRLTVREVLAYE